MKYCARVGLMVAWLVLKVAADGAEENRVALTRLQDGARSGVSVGVSAPEAVEAGGMLSASVSATNSTDAPVRLTVRYSLQRDPALHSQPLPDPVSGSDHAAGTRSWLAIDGEVVENSNSTDGKAWTNTRSGAGASIPSSRPSGPACSSSGIARPAAART